MKTRNSKIFALILVFALILSAAIITATAAGEENKPEIIAKNVEYGDNFKMMFAVDATNLTGEVSLEFYAPDGTLIDTYKNSTPEQINIDGESVFAYVFYTKGVAAKDMGDEYTAKAVAGTAESDVVYYSVAQYMLERLYGGQTISDNQRKLYASVLQMGANAQQVLIIDKQTAGWENEVLVSELCFVDIVGANAEGKTQFITRKGTSLTLTPDNPANGWTVTYPDGSSDILKKTSTPVVISQSCTISAGYMDNSIKFDDWAVTKEDTHFVTSKGIDCGYGILDLSKFNNTLSAAPSPLYQYAWEDTNGNGTMDPHPTDTWTRSWGSTVFYKIDEAASAEQGTTVYTDINRYCNILVEEDTVYGEASKVLHFHHYGTNAVNEFSGAVGTAGGDTGSDRPRSGSTLTLKPQNTVSDGNCLVFESDIKFTIAGKDGIKATDDYTGTWTVKNTANQAMFVFSLANYNAPSGEFVVAVKDNNNNYTTSASAVAAGEWFHLRMEFYNTGSTAKAKVFINDVSLGELVLDAAATSFDVGSIVFGAKYNCINDTYFDNLLVQYENATYAAE